MKSEKEIKERVNLLDKAIEEHDWVVDGYTLKADGEEFGCWAENNEAESWAEALKWVLEGEPRYSLNEFFKLKENYNFINDKEKSVVKAFLGWIDYNSEKVKEVLESDKE